MNQENKYRRSRLRNLSESVSANLSLSVCPCLRFASEYPPLPRKCFPFISQDPGPSMAQNFIVFDALVLKRRPRYARGVPEALEFALLVCCSVGPPRYCEALRRNVKCLVVAYPRLLLQFLLYSPLQVFSSII